MKKAVVFAVIFFLIIAAISCKKTNPAEPPLPTATLTNTPHFSPTTTLTAAISATMTGTSTTADTATMTPTIADTATITPTDTGTVLINVQAAMMTSNGGDQVVVFIDAAGTPFPDATVLVNSTPVPYESDSGSSSTYRLINTVPYTYGQTYTFSISAFGLTATDTTPPAPGDVTIPDDGISVSWLYEGTNDRLTVYDSAMNTVFNADPDIDSPFDIPASAYAVSGDYTVHVVVENDKYSDMNNPSLINSATLRIYDYHYRTVTK